MKPLLFISIVMLSFAAYVAIRESNKSKNTEKAIIKEVHSERDYKIIRDTVLIDRGRSDCNPWYQYQIELGQDSTYIWNGQRLVGVMHYSNSNIDSAIIEDNR